MLYNDIFFAHKLYRSIKTENRLSFSYFFKLVIAISSAVGLMWCGQKLYTPSLSSIHYVHILGNDSKQINDILYKAIAPFASNGLFRISAKEIELELKDWDCVERVVLRPIFPCLLIVHVYQRTPIATFQSDVTTDAQPTQWLDKTGFIFTSPPQTVTAKLPKLIGSKKKTTQLLRCYQTLESLLKKQYLQVNIMHLDTQNRYHVELSNGIRLLLGHLDPYKQLQQLLYVHPFILQQSDKVAMLDLRYPKGIAITWREPTI